MFTEWRWVRSHKCVQQHQCSETSAITTETICPLVYWLQAGTSITGVRYVWALSISLHFLVLMIFNEGAYLKFSVNLPYGPQFNFSVIVISCSNPFLEPTSTKQ